MKKAIGERGFFLSEVMVSVSILMVIFLLVLPILTHVHHERLIVRQKNEALTILRYQLTRWQAKDLPFPEQRLPAGFHLQWGKKTDHEARLNVYWTFDNRSFVIGSEARK
ncbi:MAG: type II secretion system GspH family protein [Sporolactobacillus sp.]|nr:type II secretion system GspH family protein [Sporolactobacillus sp.]MCI1882786.1 type II secretion system GspH family protein [Sporolactobacillus sp.]